MKQKSPVNFWEAAFSPSPDFIVVFILTLLITGLAGNLLFGILMSADTLSAEGIFWTIAAMIVFSLIAGFIWTNRQVTKIPFHVSESQKLHKAEVVIAIPSNVGTIGKIARYHAGTIQYIWLVGDSSQDENASQCQRDYAVEQLKIERIRTGEGEDAKNIYEGYQAAFNAALAAGFTLSQIVSDITGGTKPMSISAFLAAQERGIRVSYVQSNYEQINGSHQTKISGEEFAVVAFDMSIFPFRIEYDTATHYE